MRKTIHKLKAKASEAFRPSGNKVLSGVPKSTEAEPLEAASGGSAQVSSARASTTQEPLATIPSAGPPATDRSLDQVPAAQDPVPRGSAAQGPVLQSTAPQLPTTETQSAPDSVALQSSDSSICKLWEVAYENLRQEEPELINKYETFICGDKDMSAAFVNMLPVGHLKRDQMQFVLQKKIDDAKNEAWKLKFGSWKQVEVKEIVEPVLGVINMANRFITQAISGNSQASIAWAGISLLLPLLLNPGKQASSLAKALEYISSLIVQGRMREELYIRRCESSTGAAGEQGISPKIYKDGLESLYRHILRLQTEAYCYYASNKTRIARDIVRWDDWDALLTTVKEREYYFLQINEAWKDAKYDDDCSATQKHYTETRRDLQAIGVDLTGLRQVIGEARLDSKRSALLAWLYSFDSSHYNHNLNLHERGTGEWLLNDCTEFTKWQKLPASFLWLHGKVGCGKSVLSSSVIKHLRSTYEVDPQTALAYFYFDFAKAQSIDTMFSSMIRQLCARRPTIPPSVDGFHEYMDRGDRPDTVALEEALIDTTCCFSAVYIVIDGLDEVSVINDQRWQLMRRLCHFLSRLPDMVHVFCTSRREPDIWANMKPLLAASHRASLNLTQGAYRTSLDSDIKLYIASTLQSTAYNLWSQVLKDEVQDILVDKADGMFQYVHLQLQELRKTGVSSPSRLRQTLKALPRGLDETYDRILQKIDENVISEVRLLLMWLAFGNDSSNAFDLTLETLAQVLLFQPNRVGMVDDEEQLFEAEAILKFMPGLVVTFVPRDAVREWMNVRFRKRRSPSSKFESDGWKVPPRYVFVRITHLSVQEYLMSDRIRGRAAKIFAFSETEAHVHIAQTWLAYHSYSCSTNRSTRLKVRLRRQHPNVCWQWAHHMEAVRRQAWPEELENAALCALAPQSQGFNCFRQIFDAYDLKLKEEGIPGKMMFISRMLLKPHCCTAFAGWFKLTQLLLSGTSGVNRYLTQRDLDAVLYCAAYQGHVDIVRLALETGASLHSRHVTRRGHSCRGSSREWILQTALQAAANNGHLTTVKLLLTQGADIDARDSFGQSALHTLLQEEGRGRRSSPEMTLFLLDHGADVNALDNEGCSVLKAAMSSYYIIGSHSPAQSKAWVDTIRLLVDRGADPRTCSSSLGVPFGEGLEATRYILDKGADVNQLDRYGKTALHEAVTNAEKDTFLLLIERGAHVTFKEGEVAPSVLQTTCHSRYGVKYLPDLLNKGVDLATPPYRWGSAIHAICLDGLIRHGGDCLGMVRMVLKAGADVNAEGGECGYPLQAAVAASYHDMKLGLELVEFLLASGADVNAQGGKYGSALQAACCAGQPDLVRLLLDRDADPNAAGGQFGNPLTAAVGTPRIRHKNHRGKRNPTIALDIVRTLLEAGAQVNAMGNRRYGTALHAAAENASADVVRLLLEHGANANGHKGGLYGTPLQAACATRRGDPSIPRLLIERGADVLARGGHYGSVFHAAVAPGYIPEPPFPRKISRTFSKDTVDLLLASEPHLDVNDIGGFGETTAIQGLMESSFWAEMWFRKDGYEAVVVNFREKLQLLVEHGVDVNHYGGGKYAFPLQAACALDPELSFGRAEMLLELFPTIEVNTPGGFFGFPLQAAAYSGQESAVRMMLSRKVDVNARGGRYGSALNAAVLWEHWNIVEILRDAGAKADCEILEVPDQLWLWQIEREDREKFLYRFYNGAECKQYGEDGVERYEKFWEVETREEIPVDRVLEWLFG